MTDSDKCLCCGDYAQHLGDDKDGCLPGDCIRAYEKAIERGKTIDEQSAIITKLLLSEREQTEEIEQLKGRVKYLEMWITLKGYTIPREKPSPEPNE